MPKQHRYAEYKNFISIRTTKHVGVHYLNDTLDIEKCKCYRNDLSEFVMQSNFTSCSVDLICQCYLIKNFYTLEHEHCIITLHG